MIPESAIWKAYALNRGHTAANEQQRREAFLVKMIRTLRNVWAQSK